MELVRAQGVDPFGEGTAAHLLIIAMGLGVDVVRAAFVLESYAPALYKHITGGILYALNHNQYRAGNKADFYAETNDGTFSIALFFIRFLLLLFDCLTVDLMYTN